MERSDRHYPVTTSGLDAWPEQGRQPLFEQIVVLFPLEIDLPEDRTLVSALQFETAGRIFQVEADDGPIELARSGFTAFFDRLVLIRPDRVCGQSRFKLFFQPSVHSPTEQMHRGVPAVREKEPEAVPAAKIHDPLGFGLHPVVEHVAQGLDLGEDEMPGFEVDSEIGIGAGFEFSTPIGDCGGLLPVE